MANETNQKIMDYQALFTSEIGARVLADLDAQLLYRRDLFNENSARVTDFNLGKNAAIRYIHSWMEKQIVNEPEQKTVIANDVMEGAQNEQ